MSLICLHVSFTWKEKSKQREQTRKGNQREKKRRDKEARKGHEERKQIECRQVKEPRK